MKDNIPVDITRFLKEEYKYIEIKRGTKLADSLPFISSFWDEDKNELSPSKLSYGSDKKIHLICEKGHKFHTKPSELRKGQWCNHCPMWGSLTNYDIDNYFKESNRNIKRLDSFTTSLDKLSWECLDCSNVWITTFNNIKSKGSGCPKCNLTGRKLLWSSEDIDNYLISNEIPIKRVGAYTNSYSKTLWECNVCRYQWETSYSSIRQGTGCARCQKSNPHDNIYVDNYLISNSIPIKRLSEYTNAGDKLNWECLKCGHVWKTGWYHISGDGSGCPQCKSSRGEKRIHQVLTKLGVSFLPQYKFSDCRNRRVLPFDFCILDDRDRPKLLIEYDGAQHFMAIKHFGGEKSFIKTKVNDSIKNKYCKDNNIRLLRIPYTDYLNIEETLQQAIDKLNEEEDKGE